MRVSKPQKIRRLFLDIETCPNVGLFWRTGKQYINHKNILHERAIICAAWGWEDTESVQSAQWEPSGKYLHPGDDTLVLATIAEVFAEADEIVAHNGDRFDIPWVRGRCLKFGFDLPPVHSVDTYQQSRRLFNLNNYSLRYLAQYLEVDVQKGDPDYDLWKDVLFEEKGALNEMVDYCMTDIEVLEQVYKKILPYSPIKIHASGDLRLCGYCGEKVAIHKHWNTGKANWMIQVQCTSKTCGKYNTFAARRFHKEASNA